MGISSNMIEALQINPWNFDVYSYLSFPIRSLTRHPRAGCGGGYAPWPTHVAGRQGFAPRQVAQRHHNAHIANLGYDHRQIPD